jgi:2-dehydro-3-deoxyphosphogluconate aldolase/(4S)-4-hydroxy-2-oxoglutarate aldolase
MKSETSSNDAFARRLTDLGVIPVVEIDDARRATNLARTLVDAGLPCAEITFRTAAAADAVAAIAGAVPELYLGAGTVRTIEQADAAVASGAQFLVAPGYNPRVVNHARELGVPMLPGVSTPSEIDAAYDDGLRLLKFFPAGVLGGVRYLKAIAPAYGDVRFVPTGGIDATTLQDYLGLSNVAACGGSWIVGRQRLADGDFDAIGRLAAEAVAAVDALRRTAT